MTINELIEDNMNLVYWIISRQYPTFLHDDDVIQSGMLGLCKAANTFDPNKGVFSTYAGRCIRNEINQEFIKRKPFSQTVSLDTKIGEEGTLQDVLEGEKDVDYMSDEFYDALTDEERTIMNLNLHGYGSDAIADICKITVKKVQKILRTIKIKWRKYENQD